MRLETGCVCAQYVLLLFTINTVLILFAHVLVGIRIMFESDFKLVLSPLLDVVIHDVIFRHFLMSKTMGTGYFRF